MTNRTTRALAAICGIAGVAMLTAHFLIPASVPPDSASLGRIAAFAREHRDAILVGLTLLDSAMIISSVQSAAHGQTETLRVGFDLIAGPGNDAIGRSFLIAPAILLPLAFVILQTDLLPRAYGLIAIAFGAVSQALGLVGLFSKVAFADVNPAVLALENLWLIVVAITLLVRRAPRQNSVNINRELLEPTT